MSENRQMIGQYPPESEADVSLAATETERHTVRWMHEVYNRKMLGTIAKICAATVQFHGPLMSELYGVASVMHQTLGLIGSLPDAAFTPQHICSNPCEEGGEKVAVRWIMEGHHLVMAFGTIWAHQLASGFNSSASPISITRMERSWTSGRFKMRFRC